METHKETWRKGIKITDLKEGDVIYIQKMKSGFSVTIEGSFISYEKGIVTAEAVSVYPDYWKHDFKIGDIITARPRKCYLYGKRQENMLWSRCHWCKKGVFE